MSIETSHKSKYDLLALLKKQEEKISVLESSVNKYQNLFNCSLDGIYRTAPNGSALYANTALVTMLGYDSKEELLAIDVRNKLYVDYSNRQKVLDHFSEKEKIWHQLYKKDGSTIWVENHGKEIKNDAGELLYYEGIIKNVTEAKRAKDIQEVLLNIAQHVYQLENLKEYSTYIISELGKLIDVSNSYIAYYNKGKETISIPYISGEETDEEFPIGKTTTGYLIKNKKPLLLGLKELKKLEAAGKIELIGTPSKVWLGVPLIIDNEAIGAIVVQSYDNENAFEQGDIKLLELVSSHISETIWRHKKNFELRKFSQAVYQSANTIVITNTEGKIEYVNAKFTETTGYSKEEAIGQNPRILNSGIQDKKYYSNLWKTITSGEEWKGEFQNKNKKGEIYWERAVITAIKNSDNVITNYLAIKEDITLQKKKDEELAISKEILRKVLDNIPINVFWKNKDSKFLGCNNSFLKSNSFKHETELIGKYDSDFCNKKDSEKFRKDDLAIMLSGKPKLNFQSSSIINGKKTWTSTSKLPFYDENNNVIGIIGTSEDITARIEKEKELAMSKELLRKILDNIPVRIYWKDRESKFLGCNNAYLKEMGLNKEEDVIGKTDFDVHLKKDAERFRASEIEIMSQAQPKLKYIEVINKTNKTQSVLTSKVPFFNDNKDVIGILGVSEDITERIEKEKELALSKEVLRKVLDNIPIRVFWKDRESKFLGCNESYYKGINFKSDKDVIGKTDYDWNDKEVADKTRKDELEIINSGIPKLRYLEKFIDNGEEVVFSTNKLPFIDQNNNIIGTIGTSVDITKRLKSTEKLKQATEEAISANLSKSVFLSNMSHEIRTPLNAILGYSQLLQDDTNLTNIQYENLKTINRSGEHLLALINDILDMSKIEAGRITLKNADFNFTFLLKEVEKLFKFKAAQKNIQLGIEHVNCIPEIIFGDEAKIRQVIINLVGNAIKFTPKGSVQILVENLENNFIRVSVKDSGIGILKEEQDNVFKPFEQAQKGKRVSGGTGLGLAISKKFSKLMKGDITIESEYGKGSEFIFEFKYEESEQNNENEETKELKVVGLAPEMKGLKLAIVDDRFENRDILFQKFAPLGFDIKQAENGLEAIELYKNWKPDIILLDVVMPKLNGIEATREILKLRGDHNVKIFIISASALESEQQEVMKIGATVFIKKPVNFVDLLAEMVDKGNVKFVYEEQKKVEIHTGNVSEVPKELKEKFINAAEEGDFLLLENLLAELENETNKSFIDIDNYIKEMEFEDLIKWLNP
ncbi:PAS domain S-box-containing protein [Lutibacter oricola]|uniref:Sensory/regulatory protein RpfC n=1 Tax=Lutibacter oricola TaxID=762486 RepID=A0A1H2YPR4_9FLAO|nr:PAS domain S-box protein [Lutibacter oricola]SDX07202.1 PAS domain S-box-containing protein [Lutibacter oricola]